MRTILENQAISALKGQKDGEYPSQQLYVYYSDPEHDKRFVSDYTEEVLRRIMRDASVTAIWITSTVRDELDQARAMLKNLKKERALIAKRNAMTDEAERAAMNETIRNQHVGYARPGRQVLAVAGKALNAGEGDEAVIEKMIEEIKKVGLSRVTKHAATSGFNTVDISWRRIRKTFGKRGYDGFVSATKKAVSDGRVARFGWPGGPQSAGKFFLDGACFHLEVAQPGSGG